MAKLNEFKNPVVNKEVNVLNPTDWVQSIGYVAFMGLVVAMGAKLLVAADKYIPGNNTPKSYANMVSTPAASTLTVY